MHTLCYGNFVSLDPVKVWYGEKRGIFECPSDLRKKNVSYYLNEQLTTDSGSAAYFHYKLSQIRRPSIVMLMVDGWTNDSYQTGGFRVNGQNFINWIGGSGSAVEMPDFRHSGRTNMTMVDGHVENRQIGGLPRLTRRNVYWDGETGND